MDMRIDNIERSAMRIRLRAYIGEYIGLAEFAAILGISRQHLSNWTRRKVNSVPTPYTKLAMGPIWTRSQVKDYIES